MTSKSLLLSFAALVVAVVAVVAVAAAIHGGDEPPNRDTASAESGGGDGITAGDGAFGMCLEGAVDCVDTPLPPPDGSGNPDEPVSSDGGAGEDPALGEDARARALELALDDLAGRLGVETAAITVVSTDPIIWGNACLGIVTPEVACAEVITPGFVITLRHEDQTYVYHTDEGRTALLAE